MRQKVLLTVLNWGLGHASRMVPVINHLLKRGCNLDLASDGLAFAYLQHHFPQLNIHQLAGWNVKYWNLGAVPSIAVQLPGIFRSIRKEHRMVDDLVRQHAYSIIISDNRYGCYHAHCKSILIGHQLSLAVGNSYVQSGFRPFFRLLDQKFDKILVPDYPMEPKLLGTLNNWSEDRIQFIGPLSAIEIRNRPKDLDLLIVASGPEPSRTEFETLVAKQLKEFDINYKFASAGVHEKSGQFTFKNCREMGELFSRAKIVLARPGYSTIMDLCQCHCKAILVPTPFQIEQELLATTLAKRAVISHFAQRNFNLMEALTKVQKTEGFKGRGANLDIFKQTLDDLIG